MSGYNKCAKGEEVEEVYFTLILLLAQLATAGTSPMRKALLASLPGGHLLLYLLNDFSKGAAKKVGTR